MIIVSQPSHKNVFMMAGFTWESCSVQVITQCKEFCDNMLLVLHQAGCMNSMHEIIYFYSNDNMVTGIGAGHVIFLLALKMIGNSKGFL